MTRLYGAARAPTLYRQDAEASMAISSDEASRRLTQFHTAELATIVSHALVDETPH